MKHSITVKFLVVLLTALSLVAAFAGTAGIVSIESAGLYVTSLDELQNHEYESIARTIATNYARLYAAETLGDVPYILKQELYSNPADRSDTGHWYVSLRENGITVSEFGSANVLDHCAAVEEFKFAPLYPIVSTLSPEEMEEETPTAGKDESFTPEQGARNPVLQDDPVPEDWLYYEQETMWSGGKLVTYYLYYYQAPEYVVNVFLQEKVLESSSLHILTLMYPYRYTCIAVLAMGLLFFAAGMVFLFWVAGKDASGEVRPGGLNRLPLDVYALMVASCIFLLIQLLIYLSDWMQSAGPHPGKLSLLTVVLLAITVLSIGFLYAFASQVKLKSGYWWHHSFIGWLCAKIWQFLRFLWRSGSALIRLMPVIWQWLLTAAIMGIAICTACLLTMWHTAAAPALIIILLICACIVLYGGYSFGTLICGAKRMSEGDLNHKIPENHLRGSFRDFARQLNTLSETAKLSAENEMRSERMKSELITNVSHDIKTPLTSIINYVDLLQKPHTQQQEAEYLEVLARQSARMKKLIEDLMELSKASTGNVSVSIIPLNATEAVNQALGEFSDKLEAAQLSPVFQHPDVPVMMKADGRLAWRVLSNLLGNAVKYAMPGTRLYIDLAQIEDKVLLSLKNVSRESLTIDSDELMERFVRGDASRKSEGSGLGLNIAKSLMEVQNGQMQLLLDGDLFKVTLIFPADQ